MRNVHALGALGLVCDPAEAGRAAARAIAPDVEVVGDFERALGDDSVSGVMIATPAETHRDLAVAALEAGKHVFVEKPMALNVRQGQEICAAARKAGRVVMVGHLLRYHPYVQRILATVGSGTLGRLQYITSNRLNLGKIRREENALWSFAPHDLSVILAIAGDVLPEMIRCQGEAWLTRGVADTTLTTLRFAGGLRGHVYVSWLNPFKEQKLTVVGSEGMLVFDDTRAWDEKLMLHRQPVTWSQGQVPTLTKSAAEAITVPESEPLREECSHFLSCIREGSKPRTDGDEGLRVLSVLEAAQASMDSDGEAKRPALGFEASDYFAHPTAVVDEGARIGKDTKIWHFSHVMKGAVIGRRCILGQNVNVDGGARLGDNVKVQNNVSVYAGVEIESDVFLGPSCVLTNVSNPRSQVNRHSLYERTVVRRGATIGANATVVCGREVGAYAFIAAGSVVTKDVPAYALMMGNPARQVGWMSRHGHKLAPSAAGTMTCPESGHRYVLEEGRLRCLDLADDAPLPAELVTGRLGYRALNGDGGR